MLVNETTQAFSTVGLVQQRAMTKNPGPSWERVNVLNTCWECDEFFKV